MSGCGHGGRHPQFFFGLAPYRRRLRVLALQPIRGAAGAVGRALTLGHDAFESELAGMLEDERAVFLDVLVKLALARIFTNLALGRSIGSPRKSSPFGSITSKANKITWHRAPLMGRHGGRKPAGRVCGRTTWAEEWVTV
jgi:hypothetical protein